MKSVFKYFRSIFTKVESVDSVKSKNVMFLQNAQTQQNEMIFAVGDIHGCLGLLEDKLIDIQNKMIELNEGDDDVKFHIVFLGDYIDRGEESKQVIEKLMKINMNNCEIHCLLGNHEDILLKFLSEPKKFLKIWMAIGGAATLSSFGIDSSQNAETIKAMLIEKMGIKMISFLSDLDISYVNGDYFFCHALPVSNKPLLAQSKRILINNRKENESNYEKIVVHGHVSRKQVEFVGSRINIDTGAYATGNLTCLLVYNYNQTVL